MTLTSKDRRVQFASGPWEHYADGHPPEKACEEDRRAYRLGLTLQKETEPSLFEQSISWLEASFQSAPWCAAGCYEMEEQLDFEGKACEDGAMRHGLDFRHDSVTSLGGYALDNVKDRGVQDISDLQECEMSRLLPDSVSISIPSTAYGTSGGESDATYLLPGPSDKGERHHFHRLGGKVVGGVLAIAMVLVVLAVLGM